jgi:hypothetical protein
MVGIALGAPAGRIVIPFFSFFKTLATVHDCGRNLSHHLNWLPDGRFSDGINARTFC